MAENALLALSTFPDVETARRIARQLVTENFAACANIIPAIESIYRWKEKIETSAETLVFFKLSEDRQSSFQEKLCSLHPYEVPGDHLLSHREWIAGIPAMGCRQLPLKKATAITRFAVVSCRRDKSRRRWRWR